MVGLLQTENLVFVIYVCGLRDNRSKNSNIEGS